MKNKAQKWVLAALAQIITAMPFKALGIDSDNETEFINAHLRNFCDELQITFTRSCLGNKNYGAHMEGKPGLWRAGQLTITSLTGAWS